MGFYFVYILRSQVDNRLYIGYTVDVYTRLNDHNAGKNVSTRKRRPLHLIYYEAHLSKTDAMRRERYFKSSKGRTTIKQILR